ncbi:uncharacterized protein LOC141895231 [Acropora palmata]|uniref:uncharacterized protein LOC141895231 n=1 Tax=Acropora palmata TaxID=6131 RepID=UPI003D9FE0A1
MYGDIYCTVDIVSTLLGLLEVLGLLVIQGLGLVLRYQMLSELYDRVPLVMTYGLPVSGKSLAVQIVMSVIGEDKSFGECTQAGLLKLASLRALPFWWDDVCNFDTLESLVVQAFNQSQKQTARQEKASQPRSMPLMTMNPHCLYKKKRVSKEKISR